MRTSTLALLRAWAFLAICAGSAAQESRTLGRGPAWRGPVRPTAANEVFATGDGCAMCHSAAPRATAMRSPAGDDVSPHALWRASMMANSFRDPYWRAQVTKEIAAAPGQAAQIQALCIRCHAPMAHHSARLAGADPLTLAAASGDELAKDGVSCTVCHQIEKEGLGEPRTFGGNASIGRTRTIFGPYTDPAPGPMRMHSGYTPAHAPHVTTSAMCGSCHTLFTGHLGHAFPEQTPYLEWRNSTYQAEKDPTTEARTCQDCHMPRIAPTRIARNPMGRDFLIPPREGYATHVFVGGNAFMLDILRTNRERLGVVAPDAALARAADATRRQLQHDTARVSIGRISREGDRLVFSVAVENLAGHKLPTGYPSRRAWIHVQVRDGEDLVFETGDVDDQGRLKGVTDELRIPHRTTVERASDVVVYELVAFDSDGAPTTHLARMARRGKDTRLLPKGWREDGPAGDVTAPVGCGGDADFGAGGDVVSFRIPIPDKTSKGLRILAWLRYQSVPPAWVAALRSVDAQEARQMVSMYDAADKTPETLAVTNRFEE